MRGLRLGHRTNHAYFLKYLPILLLLIGSAYIVTPKLWYAQQRHAGVNTNRTYWHTHAPVVSTEPIRMQLGTPTEFAIDRLDIHLTVQEGSFNPTQHTWLLDRTHVFFIAPGSSPLSDQATPLIYGHDIPGVFRGLAGVTDGEPLKITNDQGRTLLFKYVGDTIVQPNQITELNASHSQPGITVLTCTGPRFSQRRLLFFAYVSTAPQQVATTSSGGSL